MSGVDVLVVAVTWNSAAVIDGCLAALPAGLDGLCWQLTVADNASQDDTVARVEQWSREHRAAGCRVVQTGFNAGYAGGINAALAGAAPHKAALILNPDIRLEPACVRRMFDLLAGHCPGTGIVVPRLSSANGSLARSLRREPTVLRALGEAVLGARAGRFGPLGELVLDDASYRSPTVADWATGAIMLISADCLARCGPWDESFFLYSEETEFALRARDRGFATRLAPDASAVHLGGESRVSPALWTLVTLNKLRLYSRLHALPAAIAYWFALLLRELPRAAAGRKRSRHAVAALLSPAKLRALPSDVAAR